MASADQFDDAVGEGSVGPKVPALGDESDVLRVLHRRRVRLCRLVEALRAEVPVNDGAAEHLDVGLQAQRVSPVQVSSDLGGVLHRGRHVSRVLAPRRKLEAEHGSLVPPNNGLLCKSCPLISRSPRRPATPMTPVVPTLARSRRWSTHGNSRRSQSKPWPTGLGRSTTSDRFAQSCHSNEAVRSASPAPKRVPLPGKQCHRAQARERSSIPCGASRKTDLALPLDSCADRRGGPSPRTADVAVRLRMITAVRGRARWSHRLPPRWLTCGPSRRGRHARRVRCRLRPRGDGRQATALSTSTAGGGVATR